MSCLLPEKRKELKNYLDPSLYKKELNSGVNVDNHLAYFANMDHNWKNRTRKKKYLSANKEEINHEWRLARERVLEIAEQSLREENKENN